MNISELKPLPNGSGSFGKCFIVNENILYKKLFLTEEGTLPIYEDSFENIVGLNNDTFIFPMYLDIDKEYIRGLFLKWIHARNMEEINSDILISTVIEALDKFRLDLKKVSDIGIVIDDITSENMLFNDQFYMIDLESSKFNFDMKDLFGFNEASFVWFFDDYFTSGKYYSSFCHLLSSNKKLNKSYYDVVKGMKLYYFQEFLYVYKKIISDLADSDVDNLRNVHKVLSRIEK